MTVAPGAEHYLKVQIKLAKISLETTAPDEARVEVSRLKAVAPVGP